jgi:HPt (histidine-containing phosphotransfer) domain-containing protein
MIAEPADPPAVFDPAAVRDLTGHPEDDALAIVLVARFRALLPERVRRIGTALAAEDPDEATAAAMDAVLSLKVASCTVGAHELAGIAEGLERLLRRGELAEAVVVATTLAAAVARAEHALGGFLEARA